MVKAVNFSIFRITKIVKYSLLNNMGVNTMKTKLKNYFLSAIFSIPLAFGFMVQGAVAEKVMRVIPHADLKNLDPIWTTAYISRNHDV